MIMNLFICATPLHVLISSKIIEKEKLSFDSCIMIYLAACDNNKNKIFYNKLSEKVLESIYITSGRSFKTVFKMKKFIANRSCNVYVANIDDTLIHYALSFSQLNNLFTFDDGTANIMQESPFYRGISRGLWRQLLLNIIHFSLGNRFSLVKVKSNIMNHYTIFKGFKNIVDKTTYLSLFDSAINIGDDKSIIIFLGTVYEEAVICSNSLDILKKQVYNFLDSLGECLYLPHPRECMIPLPLKCTYVNTEMIAEEYVISLLQKYSNIYLYGFGSSSQYNLMNIKNIHIIPLYSKFLKENLIENLRELEKRTNKIQLI